MDGAHAVCIDCRRMELRFTPEEEERIRALGQGRKRSPNTEKAYHYARLDRQDFERRTGLRLPWTSVACIKYLLDCDRRGASFGTIRVRLSAVSVDHLKSGWRPPSAHEDVRRVLSGLRLEEKQERRPKRRGDPLLRDAVRQIIGAIPHDMHGSRDRAAILLGWFGALRASELCAMRTEHLRWEWDPVNPERRGVVIFIPVSKGDPFGIGEVVAVPYGRTPAVCAVTALQEWIFRAEIRDGFVFRPIGARCLPRHHAFCRETIRAIVIRRAERAGVPGRHGAHVLRSGWATQAARDGLTDRQLMAHGRWKSPEMVSVYVRDADPCPVGRVL